MKTRIISIVAVFAGLLPFASVVDAVQSQARALATVNGESITEDQARQAAASDLEQLQIRREGFLASNDREQHDAIQKALESILEDRLILAEAKKRGVTTTQLVATEVDEKVAIPTDDLLNRFLIANQDSINGSREQALPQIRSYLQAQDRERLFGLFMDQLKKDYKTEVYLDSPRLKVPIEGHPVLGSDQASVTIVEFSDFECPYCGRLFPVLKRIEADYKEKIRVVYMQFPLAGIHSHAQKAAEASLCAHDQHRFWEMHDTMFSDQQNLTASDLKLKAVDLKLDRKAFDSCLDSGKYADAVHRDVVEGGKLGVQGTPALIINGLFLEGARPYEDIAGVIDSELRRIETPLPVLTSATTKEKL